MSYSDSFPATRPVFQFNADAGRVSPNMTFSRSDSPIDATKAAASAVHFWSNEKHLSSENAITYSNDVSQSNWVKDGVTETGGQTAPDGGTDAYKLTENTANDEHRIYQAASERITASGSLTVSVYLKYIGRQWAVIRLTDSTGTDRRVWFDIQNGTKGTEETNMTGSITASGNGYYKCVATISSVAASPGTYVMIGGADADNSYVYAGSGADAFAIWGIQASTTGETVLNETSGQIARTYAPTLKSVSTAGQPRFEYDPTDGQSAGTSLGILVESQSTNLLNRSEEFDNAYWSKLNTTVAANAAIAPNGELAADLVTADSTGSAINHNIAKAYAFTSGNTYTLSVYAKAYGALSRLRLRAGNPATWAAQTTFILSGSGSMVGNDYGTAQIQPCGNGWYRCSITGTAGASATTNLLFTLENSDGNTSFDGDGFSGAILYGAQLEESSHSSSYLKVEGSTATRAADSLSVATADIPGFSEGVGTIVCETGGVASATDGNQLAFGLNGPASSNQFSAGVNAGGMSDSTVRVYSQTPAGDQAFLNPGTATVGTGYKLACRYELDNIAASMNGGTVVSDTSGQVPVGIDTLWIGELEGSYQINSNIKRIAVYNEALSDTNLQALTS